MELKQAGMWVFLLGVVLALITAFVELGGWATQTLIVLGVLAGVLHKQKDRKYLVLLGLSVLVLSVVTGAAAELAVIGGIITRLAMAYLGFLGPVALTAYLLWGAPMLISDGEGM